MNGQQKIRIGMVLFPNLTQLDLTGPFEVLNTSPFTEIDLLWHRLEPVTAHGGLVLTPTATFAAYGPPDVLFVPGGPGVLEAMEDEALLGFIAGAAPSVRVLTSVCTGSLILAAAGLLIGKRATCHWSSLDLLSLMGARPVAERVVEDGNIITGAGVTSGIDFGLTVAARLLGRDAAERIQLLLEYDPAPPFQSGSPGAATQATVARVTEILSPMIAKRREAAGRIGREKLKL
jgi:cyclohexyl-isocyanide hydratase